MSGPGKRQEDGANMSSEHASDVVVIGGGIAGLTAAALIGHRGRRVRLFEKAGELGGRAVTQVKEGFSFNVGPHALYRDAAGIRVLAELGIRPQGGTPQPSGGHAVLHGVKHAFPSGFLSLVSTGLLSLPGKLEVAKLLGRLGSLDPAPWQAKTVDEWLSSVSKRDDVRRLLGALIRLSTYGNAPDRMSGGAALEQVQRALAANVLYLDGGWQQMVTALRDAALAAGVRIESGVRVTTVEQSAGGAVESVRLSDGTRLPCAAAIVATAPDEATALASGATHATLERWSRDAIPVRAACLDLALDALPAPRSTFGLGIDAPLYFSVHSAVASLTPGRGALVHVAKYLDPAETPDAARDLAELERFTDLLQPGWRDHVVHRRFLPHMTVTHALVTARGGGLAGRPGPAVTGAPGLYVAGDWVGDHGMLADASFASARRAAELCLRDVAPLSVAA